MLAFKPNLTPIQISEDQLESLGSYSVQLSAYLKTSKVLERYPLSDLRIKVTRKKYISPSDSSNYIRHLKIFHKHEGLLSETPLMENSNDPGANSIAYIFNKETKQMDCLFHPQKEDSALVPLKETDTHTVALKKLYNASNPEKRAAILRRIIYKPGYYLNPFNFAKSKSSFFKGIFSTPQPAQDVPSSPRKVWEYMEDAGPDLLVFLEKNPDLFMSATHMNLLRQRLIEALALFHQFGSFHGDLKPDNICVETIHAPGTTDIQDFKITLIDLDQACNKELGEKYYATISVCYAPPELLEPTLYRGHDDLIRRFYKEEDLNKWLIKDWYLNVSKVTDLFALGVILHYYLQTPFNYKNELIVGLLHTDPNKRLLAFQEATRYLFKSSFDIEIEAIKNAFKTEVYKFDYGWNAPLPDGTTVAFFGRKQRILRIPGPDGTIHPFPISPFNDDPLEHSCVIRKGQLILINRTSKDEIKWPDSWKPENMASENLAPISRETTPFSATVTSEAHHNPSKKMRI